MNTKQGMINFQVLVEGYALEASLIVHFRLINLIPSSYPQARRGIKMKQSISNKKQGMMNFQVLE
ncbi:MAG: hypothetical protein A3H45_14680 [Ignavibacteria bacterium RIFCSPLOWO2_02_FULL_55_14]|nr:MAG: hypothetical protein A2X68_12385 [Ignavibacteria bacterium GWC2_56_12]OGU69329.1 MAG: hypothetical protein A3H45_14680 [Ignavibacteria bacterium RIFCSPLOWO2_02_FULL_55_14]OGU76901.1 MAG: hypothetical protein A3G43_08790 [Ignavibacteria bacterium RIFCSPLOWO2_12_FULL_56_21]